MKNIIFKSLLLFTFLLLVNCNDEDKTSNPIENPLEGFLLASGFNQQIINSAGNGANGTNYVTGFRFSPIENGKINAITLKIPDGDEFVKVNIFEFDSVTILHSENMIVPNANTQVIKSINPIQLTKDKDYVICMYTNDSYVRSKTNGTGVTYPITSGNIKIKEFLVDPIFSADYMPTGGGTNSFNGDLSFNFQKD
jgi:hypothetical protein